MGYDTSAIVTHPYVFADARVRASFEHVDESLERTAMDGRTTTSRLVTGRVLEKLASVPGRVLVWAHYLDPHAPYVHDETSPFAWPHAAAYVREVQRTDAAVGELARALADLPDAEHTLLLVTADHGEQFGDHGAAAHGLTLYEDSVRVPMLAWSPGAALTARLRQTPLPTALEEVGAYVVALATGAPFAPADASFFYTTFFGNAQFAVVRDGMKLIYHYEANVTELFDLRADPHEMRDLADARPEEVRRLGVLVAARYFDGRVFSLDAPLTAASAMP